MIHAFTGRIQNNEIHQCFDAAVLTAGRELILTKPHFNYHLQYLTTSSTDAHMDKILP